MSNHIHLIVKAREPYRISDILRDFKKHTSKKMQEAILTGPESRKEWLLDKFAFEAKKTGRADFYKIWRDDNYAIDLSHLDVMGKVSYIHLNPVRAGLVETPDHYLFRSAIDYAGGKGLMNVVVG